MVAKTGKLVKCHVCNVEAYKTQHELDETKSGYNFCSRSCSAKVSNKTITRSQNKKGKFANCKLCRVEIKIHAHASAKDSICKTCKENQEHRRVLRQKQKDKKRPCIKCEKPAPGTCQYCDTCRKLRQIEYGKKSADIQSKIRRSKNEMYFASLCKKVFNEVLENKPMFNGWDADVIIPEYKLAILWNGNWHHKKITKKHSLKQVQARDKIKIDQIRMAGYIPYVINDYGASNHLFVELKFREMLDGYNVISSR